MRKYFRFEENKKYWDRRWSEAGQDSERFLNKKIYPIFFSDKVVLKNKGKILEIGCGLGRIVKHYHFMGKNITGIERSRLAVKKLNKLIPELNINYGDAKKLKFSDSTFDVALAFGVYHNFEFDLEKGISEFSRILKVDGSFIISMRPNNFEMWLNEKYWKFKYRKKLKKKKFHKLVVNEKEFTDLLEKYSLNVQQVYRARNMSILYRIPFLQNSKTKNLDESSRRSQGYKLNLVGEFLDKFLTTFFSYSFCNVLVFKGKKN